MDLVGQNSSLSNTQPMDNNSKDMQCPVCQETAEKKCSACKSVAYCCVDHQRMDWKDHKKVCQGFTIKKTENMGLGWFATRDLPAGFILMEEVPAIQSPVWDWKSRSTSSVEGRKCVVCGAIDCVKICSTCSWPVCDDQCEKNPLHSENECQEFVSRKLKYPSPAFWPVGMLTLCMRANSMKARDPKKFKQLMALKDFYEIPWPNHYVQELDLPTGMFEVLRGPNCLDREEFRKLLRIWKVNDFNFQYRPAPGDTVEESKELNFHVGLKASRLNHSCMANCMASIVSTGRGSSTKIRVFTTTSVAKDEQLTIDYYRSPFGFGATMFRQLIMGQNGLCCKCKRCADPTELGTFLLAFKCFSCSSHLKAEDDPDGEQVGFLVPTEPLNFLCTCQDYKCHRCSFTCPRREIMDVLPPCFQNIEADISLPLLAKPVDFKSLDISLTKYEEDPVIREHFHRNHWIIQGAVRHVVKAQMDSLDEMTEGELDKLLWRLESFLAVGDKLYPGYSGYLFPPKYEDLMNFNKVAVALLDRFGVGMAPEKRANLEQIRLKVQEEQLGLDRFNNSLNH